MVKRSEKAPEDLVLEPRFGQILGMGLVSLSAREEELHVAHHHTGKVGEPDL